MTATQIRPNAAPADGLPIQVPSLEFPSSPPPPETTADGELFVLGTEIEYAPLYQGSGSVGPVEASAAVVASGLGLPVPIAPLEFDGEWADAASQGPPSGLIRTPRLGGLVAGYPELLPSAFLSNGSRFYVDHAHPEYSTPEVFSPIDAVHAELAGDRLVSDAAQLASAFYAEMFGDDSRVRIFKSNSDGKGHSWGAHENYLLPRSLSMPYIIASSIGFFVTRQIFCGAGKVGSENGRPDVGFQLSQRSDFFTRISSLQTTHDRGIVNTRDEPHADPELFRRLHVICGDANLSPYALWLKLGSTALVLLAAARGAFDPISEWVQLADPVSAIWRISHDVDLAETFKTISGFEVSALDLAAAYFDAVASNVEDFPYPSWAPLVLEHWSQVLDDLALDPLSLADRLDWAAKLRMLSEAGLELSSPRARAVDLIYHELGSGLAHRLADAGMWRLPPGFDLSLVEVFMSSPPPGSRGTQRAALILDSSRSWSQFDWSSAVSTSGEVFELPL